MAETSIHAGRWAGERHAPAAPDAASSGRPPAAIAFDRHAARYDKACDNEPMAFMRARVHAVCAVRFPAGSRVLEVGCGTGLDAAFLASRGVEVTAVDPAAGMLRRATARLDAAERPGRVRFFEAGLEEVDDVLARSGDHGRFDGLFSNFGALNCVRDLAALGQLAARRLEGGGTIVVGLLGRLCPWEMAYSLCRLDRRRALRRLARGPVLVEVEGVPVPTTYHAPGDVRRALGPGFRLRRQIGLAILVPPPWLAAPWSKAPARLRAAIAAADARLASTFPLHHLGDHVLMDFVRR